MELNDIYRNLSENIRTGSCIGLIGAGISAPIKFNGENFKGYPLGNELINILKKDRDYLKDIFDLGQIAFLIREYEGRTKLETTLKKIFDCRLPGMLPSYKYLVSLNLPCYISFNFDELLERQLEENQTKLLRLYSDNEVPLLDKFSTPVIKPHGTISKPSSICIASDEVFSFNQRIPILSNLMLSQLAGRTLLALGFSLSDPDFLELLRYLKNNLGIYMPRTYAVMLEKDGFTGKFWEKYDVNIIEKDLTDFLFDLNKYLKKQKIQLEEDLEPWLKNQFFWQLLEIRGKPTETQVIEALLKEIRVRIEKNENIDKLKIEVNEAVELVCSYRKNYHALKQMGREIDAIFSGCIANGTRPWDNFTKLFQKRSAIRDRINLQATSTITDYKNILLYSQSQRVVDLLLAVDPAIQEQVRLFIGECRPKSPDHFQDAILYAQLLRSSKYQITFIPDVAMFHMLHSNQIDLVLMGAHVVYENNKTNKFEYFVNTNGSEMISLIAYNKNIPGRIVFEKEKVERIADPSEIDISYEQEEDIATKILPQLSSDPILAERVRFVNIGYDLVNWYPNLIAVSD